MLSRVESGERSVTPDELDSILAAIGTEAATAFRETVRKNWKHITRPQFGHPNEALLWDTEVALQAIEELLGNPDINGKPGYQEVVCKYTGRVGSWSQRCSTACPQYRTRHCIRWGNRNRQVHCHMSLSGLKVQNGTVHGKPDVLEVGAGRTTVCEVQLVQGPEYGLLVEPLSDQELRQEVSEFAHHLKDHSIAAQEDDLGSATSSTPEEIQRAIRNMSGLVRPSRRERRTTGNTVDPARKLADESADSDALTLEILTRMNLSRRTKRELWYPSATSGDDPLVWLKENFALLNNGRHAEFSIPKRIEVMIPRPILGEQSLSLRLVDTKGIDDTVERADIERLLREPNTIAVMCSKFESTPSPSVHPLLKRARAVGLTGIPDKMAVLGLPRDLAEKCPCQGSILSAIRDSGDRRCLEGNQIRGDCGKLTVCTSTMWVGGVSTGCWPR